LIESVERLYRLVEWPSTPCTPEGRRKAFEALHTLHRLLDHEWMRRALSSRRVDVLDLCSGGGVAGYAMAKALRNRGVETTIILADVRCSLVAEGVQCLRRLGVEDVEGLCLEASALPLRSRCVDVALLWGLTTPHFDPWTALRVYAWVSHALRDDGLLLVEEYDRVLRLLSTGYREVSSEPSERLVVSIHRGYDFAKSTVVRSFIDLETGDRVDVELFLWSPALTALILWTIFSDVDLVPSAIASSRFVVIARSPRRVIDVRDLASRRPALLSKSLRI